jgi:hypothetical protein
MGEAVDTQIANSRPVPEVRAFGNTLRLLWLAVVITTIFLEVMPAHFEQPLFYVYKCTKGVLFIALGYLTPLTFWRFSALNRGLLFAAASAATVEILQGLIGNGHKFSWLELAAKLGIIAFGFVLALDARYEREIAIGGLRIRLASEKLPDR